MSHLELMGLFAPVLAEAKNMDDQTKHDTLWIIVYVGYSLN